MADGSLTLPQRKGTRQRNKPPVNQHRKKSNSKAGWLVDHRADLWNLESQASMRERQRKKLASPPNTWQDQNRDSA
jgi:hypothetical protein